MSLEATSFLVACQQVSTFITSAQVFFSTGKNKAFNITSQLAQMIRYQLAPPPPPLPVGGNMGIATLITRTCLQVTFLEAYNKMLCVIFFTRSHTCSPLQHETVLLSNTTASFFSYTMFCYLSYLNSTLSPFQRSIENSFIKQ